jgi:hypothetical protein
MMDSDPGEQREASDDYRRLAEAEYDEHLRDRAVGASERREILPDPKPRPRVPKRLGAPEDGLRWRDTVLERDMGCVKHRNPADCAEGWHAHHVIPQQTLRRTHPEILWHPLVGVGLCGKAHRQHHAGHNPLTMGELPASVRSFLRSKGFQWYLDRHYDIDWIRP